MYYHHVNVWLNLYLHVLNLYCDNARSARGSFDLPTSGLWAQHASAAPSCFLGSAIPNLNTLRRLYLMSINCAGYTNKHVEIYCEGNSPLIPAARTISRLYNSRARCLYNSPPVQFPCALPVQFPACTIPVRAACSIPRLYNSLRGKANDRLPKMRLIYSHYTPNTLVPILNLNTLRRLFLILIRCGGYS